jgi:hypothetical protein
MKKILAVVFALTAGCLCASAQDGTVVVYRPGKFTGSALKPSVYVDGSQVTRLGNGRYVSLSLSPGKHNFESSMKAAALEVDVKPNETVYLEMVILTGNWRGGGRLIPVAQDEAKTVLAKPKPTDEKPVAVAGTSSVPPAQENPPADNAQGGTQPATVTVKSTPPGVDITLMESLWAAPHRQFSCPLGTT